MMLGVVLQSGGSASVVRWGTEPEVYIALVSVRSAMGFRVLPVHVSE